MAKKKETTTEIRRDEIIDVEYSAAMEKSYIDYAMSVITARAVPDVRDGLKPVQRRILYSMASNGMTQEKPYRKSARIVGNTMGALHPHGDAAIYDALVVMAQDFKKQAPLVDGHGNFGSIEGDGAAASRYTEARMQAFAEDVFLQDLKYDTVDFIPNYDETEKEPVVLPCLLPHILINGSEGIAVGMTTNIPPHNTGDVIDTAIAYLKRPKSDIPTLLSYLKGPDFPTGGIIANASELEAVYTNGQGKLRVRGRAELEKSKNGKYNIVITEIPYTMTGTGIGRFLSDVGDLAENHVLPEIADILNQTSKDGIRIVLELKKGAEKEFDRIMNILYKKTKLEDTFGVSMLAIREGRPLILSLTDILQSYVEFQKEILVRKSKNLLEKEERRKEINEGLLTAMDCIDLIIEILRGSKTLKMAKDALMGVSVKGIVFKSKKSEASAKKLHFSQIQAEAILEMRLSRLVNLELQSIQEELKKAEARIAYHRSILDDNDDKIKTKEIIRMLEEMKKKYAVPRKTMIENLQETVIEEKAEPEVPVVLVMDRFSYLHSVDKGVYEKNLESLEDYKYIIPSTSYSKLLIFTDTGKMHTLKVSDIPFGKWKDKGQPLDNLCNYESKSENIIGLFSLSKDSVEELLFVNSLGFTKRVELKEFDVTRRTIDATKLGDAKSLVGVFFYQEESHILLHSKEGYFIRFTAKEIPLQKKTAVGVKGISLKEGDEVDTVTCLQGASDNFEWNGKEWEGTRIKLQRRGGKGVKAELK